MIKIYTVPNCKHCIKAKDTLKDIGVPFEEINLKDPKNREARAHYRSLGVKSAPIIEGDNFMITKFEEESFRNYMEKYAKEKDKG